MNVKEFDKDVKSGIEREQKLREEETKNLISGLRKAVLGEEKEQWKVEE